MATTKDRRQANRERRLLRSESRWLQKAVFALSKAHDSHMKFVELSGDDSQIMTIEFEGKDHEMVEVGEKIRKVVEERLQAHQAELRERMRER